jgi:hypothetical protein
MAVALSGLRVSLQELGPIQLAYTPPDCPTWHLWETSPAEPLDHADDPETLACAADMKQCKNPPRT